MKCIKCLKEKDNTDKSKKDAFSCNILWDINNGLTLCYGCHKSIHLTLCENCHKTYGRRK